MSTNGFDYLLDEEMFVGGGILGTLGTVYIVALLVSLVTYVLMSVGLYAIAKRRNIRHPWLSWIPSLGQLWILGCISDQYRYVTKGQVRNRRKWLLGLCIVLLALTVALMVTEVRMVLVTASLGNSSLGAAQQVLGLLLSVLAISFAVLVVTVVLAVLEYMALYDLFKSCEPGNAVLFLVLGIFFGILMSIFVFAVRKRDGGMPPQGGANPEAYLPNG